MEDVGFLHGQRTPSQGRRRQSFSIDCPSDVRNDGPTHCESTLETVLFVLDSLWKPLYIPSADSLDIPDDQFEALEVQSCNGVESDIEQDERPLEESILCVGYTNHVRPTNQGTRRGPWLMLTTGNLMHFVLDEIIDQGDQCTEEQAGHNLAVLHRTSVIGAQGKTTERPR